MQSVARRCIRNDECVTYLHKETLIKCLLITTIVSLNCTSNSTPKEALFWRQTSIHLYSRDSRIMLAIQCECSWYWVVVVHDASVIYRCVRENTIGCFIVVVYVLPSRISLLIHVWALHKCPMTKGGRCSTVDSTYCTVWLDIPDCSYVAA